MPGLPMYVLSIDQGTTSTRAILWDRRGGKVRTAQAEHRQITNATGWTEHDPEEIWERSVGVLCDVMRESGASAADVAALGITNQRETTLVWSKATGKPLYNAIVWMDTRAEHICKRVAEKLGGRDALRQKTGLPIVPYFSGEEVHVTDVTNASRTLLLDLETLEWDDGLREAFGVQDVRLPAVKSSAQVVGAIQHPALECLQDVKIAGILGDQQAALFGQACFRKGDSKNTYGTGCFMLQNTGEERVVSRHGLLTTVAYRLEGGRPVYALEGSVAQAGSVVQWLRDGIGLIRSSAEMEGLATSVGRGEGGGEGGGEEGGGGEEEGSGGSGGGGGSSGESGGGGGDNGGVYFVPAFTGLFAPRWRADARGVIVGITGGTTKAHIARAALEATAFQSAELLRAMEQDSGIKCTALRVDGGMTANAFLLQFQADIAKIKVVKPAEVETTALGAAYAAGLTVGVWKDTSELQKHWRKDREFEGVMEEEEVDRVVAQWERAVDRSLSLADPPSSSPPPSLPSLPTPPTALTTSPPLAPIFLLFAGAALGAAATLALLKSTQKKL